MRGEHGQFGRRSVLAAFVASLGWASGNVRASPNDPAPDGPDRPLVRAVKLSSKTVRPDGIVKARIDVGDRWGILESPYIEYRYANGVLGSAAFFKRVQGGPRNGIWEAEVYFDEYVPYGDAIVARLYLFDARGRTTNLWNGEGILTDLTVRVAEYVDTGFRG